MSAPPKTTTVKAAEFVSTTWRRSLASAQVDLLKPVWGAAEVIISFFVVVLFYCFYCTCMWPCHVAIFLLLA